MMTGWYCDCLVCRLETSLIADLSEERASDERKVFGDSANIWAGFTGPLDLVRQLHAHEDGKDSSLADRLLAELLERNSNAPPPSVWQRLLLLVFIPTIHRSASQVTAMFPSLARDDTSQHIVAVFLEFLHSAELQTRRTHIAFTISRKLRRQAFRWAIRESRGDPPEELDKGPAAHLEEPARQEPLFAEALLEQFLDTCERKGWLSIEERDLLIRFKIEGITYQELAGRNGHRAEAVRHRIRRLLNRLRTLARETRRQRAPEQLELFPR